MPKDAGNLIWVAVHTAVIYAFLIVALRVFGRRQLTELGITELIVIALIGSSVETSMVAGDKSLLAGLVAVTTLLLSNRALAILLRRWNWLHRIMLGRPIPLVYKGRLLPRRMREAGLTEEDVRAAVRQRGYEDLNQVRLAMLELDGEISVVPAESSGGNGEGSED